MPSSQSDARLRFLRLLSWDQYGNAPLWTTNPKGRVKRRLYDPRIIQIRVNRFTGKHRADLTALMRCVRECEALCRKNQLRQASDLFWDFCQTPEARRLTTVSDAMNLTIGIERKPDNHIKSVLARLDATFGHLVKA